MLHGLTNASDEFKPHFQKYWDEVILKQYGRKVLFLRFDAQPNLTAASFTAADSALLPFCCRGRHWQILGFNTCSQRLRWDFCDLSRDRCFERS